MATLQVTKLPPHSVVSSRLALKEVGLTPDGGAEAGIPPKPPFRPPLNRNAAFGGFYFYALTHQVTKS